MCAQVGVVVAANQHKQEEAKKNYLTMAHFSVHDKLSADYKKNKL